MAMLHLTFFANVINKALLNSISSRIDLTALVDGDDDKMADTSQQQQEVTEPPQTNGVLDGLTEEEKSKMRPADIDADMREMERRKRVEMMMNSRLFREELERIIETQMKDGAGPSGLLQQISEMMGPQGARFNANVFRNSNCVVPINDIRGVESMGYAKGEKLLRCKLAAVFRLLDLYGWTQGVGGMITARLNQDQEHFLVNPYGLLYHEVTASSLVKVDMQGGVVEQGTTNFGVHIASYQLHSTIHAARPDIKCIVHIATPSVTAISATKSGILPLGQESIVIGEVNSHHYISGSNLDPEEREKLARNFGPINKVMLLTNRGALCCGETVEEAFFNVYNTVLACETQLKLMPLGVDNLNLVSDEARKAIYDSSRKAPVPQHSSVAEPSPLAEKLEKRWRIGGTEFEALMRMLDNAGFRTGYIYRHPLVKSEPPRPRNDVEVPPAVSSLGYLLEEEELYKQGLWKGGRKGTDRTRWLNSPNVYQKVEILETGTPDPKKITKWVSDGSPTHSSTPVKIEGALQFVPKNTNPKEFKQLQQQIKDYRRADKISAGPQSHILEGVTWEEAKKMQDATISGTGEQVVLVGAASKGIIQRGFQHNAMVYKTPYAKNPFDAVTDQELDQYKKEIERKAKGDPYDESQSESEALSSFNISRATHESSTAKSPIQSPVSVTSETEEESRDEPKVLRIETKQVPVPSQPEVVLSDERSVEPPVVENPIARREDIKSEQSKAQRATNFKSVNADFLNEQRRSEMMTRRNANGRGVSGVSRLSSSSRSNSSNEDIWSWVCRYPICHLETARSQELARPMKALITQIQSATAIKRRMKREFFENYEKRLKNNTCTEVNNKSDSGVTNSTSKFEITRAKFDKCNEINNKFSARRQLQREMEKEINEIQYSKCAGMDFAEKINLPIECTITEKNIYNLNNECVEEAYSPMIVEMDMKNNNSFEDNHINDVHAENSVNSTMKVLADNEINNNKSNELNTANKVEIAKYVTDINDNENINNHMKRTEISDSNEDKQMDNASVEKRFEEYKTNNNQKVYNSYSCNDDEEITNYVNEIEFFICNNSFDNEISEDNVVEDPLDILLGQKSQETHDKIVEYSSQDFIEKFDLSSITNIQHESNDNKITSNTENQEHEKDSVSNHSALLDVNQLKQNPPDVNLNPLLEDENDNSIQGSEQSSLNSTLKVCSGNEIDNNNKDREFYMQNDIKTDKCELDINDNKNADFYENKGQFFVRNHDNKQDENENAFQESNTNSDELCNINSEKFTVYSVEAENIDNFNCKSSDEIINYVNEVEFFISNNSPDNEAANENAKEDCLESMSKNETKCGRHFDEHFELSSSADIQNDLNMTKNANNIESKVDTTESSLHNHSTPLCNETVEKNPLDISLKKFLDNETDEEDFKLDQFFQNTNRTIKDNEESKDFNNDSERKKFADNSYLWLSTDDSTNFLCDDVKQFNKTTNVSCLDLTYSDIDKNSEDFSPASTARGSFFSDDDLIMKRITRRDSIAEVVSSMNADIIPSNKLTLDVLADTENSVKYNLDSQNMSLIYSITPPNDIGDTSKNTTVTEDILEDNEEDYQISESNNDNEDIIWINLINTTDNRESVNMNKTVELSETSFLSNVSNQGSDLLELPSHTYLDLQKSSDEIFHKNISTSVNQILTELNDAEVFISAANFVDEIMYDVACLHLPHDISKYSKLELSNLIREKIWALNFAKKLAKDLVGNLPYSDADNSANSKVSNSNEESSGVESLDQSFYVIHEVIHHVVDKNILGKWDFKRKKTVTDKKIKESMNIELKSLKDEYDAADEKSLKCSTPKMLSPSRSRNNSLSEEQVVPDLDNDYENIEIIEENVTTNSKSQQSSDTVASSNSSPSTESQNYAEQEITSESTDNDTKSDNSKEKQTDTCETLKNQSNSSNDQPLSKTSSNSPDSLINQNEEYDSLEIASNNVSFCIIEYTNEDNSVLKKNSNEDKEVKKESDTDSDDSIKDFMQSFMDHQDEINQIWQLSEAKLEEMYASERLEDISDIQHDIILCQEEIHQLCQKAEANASAIIADIEEQSTSFICNDVDINATTQSHLQFERVDECFRCCAVLEPLALLENAKAQSLSPITEEPELESLAHAEPVEPANTLEILPPISEEPDLNSSCDDSKTLEFYSCQNSASMKSCDEQEITNSTYTVSTEENSECERGFSANISTNNDAFSSVAVVVGNSEVTDLEKENANNQNLNVTENFADVPSTSSLNNNDEVVTLECMTYSYDTREFMKLEIACSNSSEESTSTTVDNYVCCKLNVA